MASGGIGNSTHVTGELFKMMAGVNLLHVPYRGSAPALTDLISGQVQVMFDVLSSSLEHVKAGRLRTLAVTTATRSDVLPDIPTVGEFVPGYEAIAVGGLVAPKGTPASASSQLGACACKRWASSRVSGGMPPRQGVHVFSASVSVISLSSSQLSRQ
jgi:tripartite-type tricarboxylate transporter receptor subunit TctC